MARFISLKNAKREYLDTLTGETVSKRQRDKALRSVFSEKPISNETAARMARQSNLELALARPARGRKSLLKVEGVEKEFILEARKEELARKKVIAEQQKEENKLRRTIERNKARKFKRQSVHKGSLIPGRKGSRHIFNDYPEYLKTLGEVKAGGNAIAYALAMQGFHETTGEPRTIWMAKMRLVRDPPYTEEHFFDMVEMALEEYSYFVFMHYFMHVAYKESYYTEVAKRERPVKSKSKRKSKRK